jgi:uncharacterized protein YgbK (DUF1537 family)
MNSFGLLKGMKELIIIADDLSSATDCSVQLAQKGYETSVYINPPETLENSDGDILVVDTNSRRMGAEKAYQQVLNVAEMISKIRVNRVYKTIDSTLRGNLGAEIDGLMDILQFDFALIAPAFPFYGRTTINGVHYLHGIPISETEIGSDPNSPVLKNKISELLLLQSARKSGLIDLELLYRGKAQVYDRLGKMMNSGVELVIFDTKNESDLAGIVQMFKDSKYRILWSGSTGLSRYLDILVDDTFRINLGKPQYRKGPKLIISGSASEITKNQIASLSSYPNSELVEMSPFRIVAGENSQLDEIGRCLDRVISGLKIGKSVILFVSSSRQDILKTKYIGKKVGLNSDQISQTIVDSLSIIAENAIHSLYLGGVILNGGDTARAVCTRLGIKTVTLVREVEPGIPLGKIRELENLPIITKAGAFGNPETFINILKTIERDS